MKKRYFIHKYLLLQLIIVMIIISITIGALMFHFNLSSNFEGVSYMFLLLLLTIILFACIIFIPIFMLVTKVEIDSNKIVVKNYTKIVNELFWKEELTMTEKFIGGARYLVIIGKNDKAVSFCYSKNVVKHIMLVCSNKHILDQLKLKYNAPHHQ